MNVFVECRRSYLDTNVFFSVLQKKVVLLLSNVRIS